MPALENPFDTEAAAQVRADQTDPIVMYLLLDKSRRMTQAQAMIAAAQACVHCAAAHREAAGHAALFDAWHARSYRKVALRADPETFQSFLGHDHGAAEIDDAVGVLALPPRYRSQAEPALQALSPVTDIKRPRLGPDPADPHPWAMQLVTRAEVAMTDGKAMAQAGHAAMMCNDSAWRQNPRYTAAFAGWWQAGLPMDVQAVPSDEFEWLKAHTDCVVVRDAGLTQVDPGTETVLATVPGVTLLR